MYRISELERVTRDLRQDVRELRGALELAEQHIRDLERLRPTCVICPDATADRQTVRGPACSDSVGDPDEPTAREIEPEPDGWYDVPDPEAD